MIIQHFKIAIAILVFIDIIALFTAQTSEQYRIASMRMILLMLCNIAIILIEHFITCRKGDE
jgi:hypothetical protein